MESNVLRKSTGNILAWRFFARTPRIRQIVKICDVLDRFLQNPFWFFLYMYIWLYIYIYIYVRMYVCNYNHVYIYIYIYICVCTHVYLYIYINERKIVPEEIYHLEEVRRISKAAGQRKQGAWTKLWVQKTELSHGVTSSTWNLQNYVSL